MDPGEHLDEETRGMWRADARRQLGQPIPEVGGSGPGGRGPTLWVNPYLALLEEVARTSAQVAWLDQLVHEADSRGGAHRLKGERPTLQRWERERDRLVKVCDRAIALGIAERQVKLAEATGERWTRALLGVAEKLGLTAEQRAALPGLLREQVQLLEVSAVASGPRV